MTHIASRLISFVVPVWNDEPGVGCVVGSLQFAVIVPARLANGVGLAPFRVTIFDDVQGVFHREPILFGSMVVKHRSGHILVAERAKDSGGRHGRRLAIG